MAERVNPVQLRITCSAHKNLGTITKALGRRDPPYTTTVSYQLDLRCRSAVAAINNHRRAWDCGASLVIEEDK